ncbi:MAG: zf-TFIIB domain-containing protein [Kiritimatiellae bacterium]|nr:zf-TFIIB domain-containing protein [Kiritimatiellia bacterium]
MTETGSCPRCGRELVRGFSPQGKVQFDCPGCGGRAVTLPVLREGLGARGVGALAQAARTGEHVGCTCPGCGRDMTLLKVGVGEARVEIDVCACCLTVWCDRGEFEQVASAPPEPPAASVPTMKGILAQASPEARERLAQAALRDLPEDVAASDYGPGDVLGDVVRLVAGAPTLWRGTRLATPLVSILLCGGILLLHAVCSLLHGSEFTGHAGRRDVMVLTPRMAEAWGLRGLDGLHAVFTSCFVQFSGTAAFCLAFGLLPVLFLLERRLGALRLAGLTASLWLLALVARLGDAACRAAPGYACGFFPIALGLCAFAVAAFPDARLKPGAFAGCVLGISAPRGVGLDLYAGVLAFLVLVLQLLGTASRDYLSLQLGEMFLIVIAGVVLGGRVRSGTA